MADLFTHAAESEIPARRWYSPCSVDARILRLANPPVACGKDKFAVGSALAVWFRMEVRRCRQIYCGLGLLSCEPYYGPALVADLVEQGPRRLLPVQLLSGFDDWPDVEAFRLSLSPVPSLPVALELVLMAAEEVSQRTIRYDLSHPENE